MGASMRLSDDARKSIAQSFLPIDSLSPGLAERLARHVCEGTDVDALLELSALENAGATLGLSEFYPHIKLTPSQVVPRPFAELLREPRLLPPVVLLRLAKTLASAVRSVAVVAHGRSMIHGGSSSWVDWHAKPAWPEVLVRLSFDSRPSNPRGSFAANHLPAMLLEELLILDDQSPDTPYRLVLEAPAQTWLSKTQVYYMFGSLDGFSERLSIRGDLVRAALEDAKPSRRIFALEAFAALGLPATAFAETLAKLAVGPARTVGGPAGRLLLEAGPAAMGPLTAIAKIGPAAQREEAIRLIGRIASSEAVDFLESRKSAEKLVGIRDLLDELTSRPPTPFVERAAIDPFAGIALAGENLAAVWRWLEDRFSPHAEAQLTLLLSPRPWNEGPDYPPNAMPLDQDEGLKRLLERPDLTPLHMVRLLCLSQVLQPHPIEQYNPVFLASPIDPLDVLITKYRESHFPRLGFRELAASFSASALDPDLIANLWYEHRDGRFLQWEPQAVWPYFSDRLDWLAEEIDRDPADETFLRYRFGHDWRTRRALAILALSPRVPESLVPRIWRVAERGKQTIRRAARKILEKLPETHDRLLELLADGKADRRAAAAEWLGQWKPPGAAESLRTAMDAEKVASVRTAIGRALESMGLAASPSGKGDQAEAIERLRKEAARGLKNGVPDKLSWFPFDRLSEIRWRNNAAPVEPLVRDWLVVLAWKAKSAEPSADLMSHAALLRPDDLRELGQSVFIAWLAEDLKPLPEDARRKKLVDLLGIFGVGSVDDLLRAHPEMAEAIERLKEAPGKGNVADRGLLAVVAAAGPTEVVTPIRDYINKWYGYRAWQCRALVTVLAWIDRLEAVAFLLDVAKRFRTATIRKEAEVQARRLAGRRRMTLAELADVSIPDAGLDAAGRVVLDFGPRRFVARLDDDAEVLLEDEGGKVVKALPSSAKSDDAEKAAAAKTRLAALKKELKSIRKRVEDRLQEALCTQRSWTFSGWQSSLLRHPIAGRLCRRAVWTATSGDGPPVTFRPLEDGSLTDLDDTPVEPAAGAEVRLAHRLTIGNELTDRWAGHLSDYEITPLFAQAFGIASRLPADLRMEATWRFRAETPVALATLGRRARGLGYDPGAFRLEDGGDRFLRHFPSVSLCAAIELADIEEVDKVTKLTLSFLRAAEGQDARAGKRIALAEVPEVLLSECIADLSRLAGAASPGTAEELAPAQS